MMSIINYKENEMKKLLTVALVALGSTAAFAGEGEGFWNVYSQNAFYFLAVAFVAYGGTASQSRAASVALEGIARNPSAQEKIVTPMILGLALMESLVIFTFITIFVAR
jgi:F-type H+-transporting ATPase subunit c